MMAKYYYDALLAIFIVKYVQQELKVIALGKLYKEINK